MYDNNYVSVLIAAAGMSSRMGSSISKQFINLNNRPVLVHTIEKFQECKLIDEIIIIARKDELAYCRENIVKKYKFNKVSKVISGGRERQDSVYNGLMAVDTRAGIIVSHDGARPFVTGEMIESSIKRACEMGAAVVGVPVTDTVKMLKEEDNGNIDYTPKRSLLWAAQTPQVFKKEILLEAYDKALNDDVLGTDDSYLVERIGYRVSMVKGSYSNIKLTTPEDIILAESLMNMETSIFSRKEFKVGDEIR